MEAIDWTRSGALGVYTNTSMDERGHVSDGWFTERNGRDSVAVGMVGPMWDGEVAGVMAPPK